MLEEMMVNKNPRDLNATMRTFVLVVAGLLLPAVILPLTKLVGYSEIVEEISKALMVLFVVLKLPSLKAKIIGATVFGLLFGVSENIFYLNNFFQLGRFDFFWKRFILTTPMHAITTLVILFSGLGKKWWLVFGFLGATFLHFLFNALAG